MAEDNGKRKRLFGGFKNKKVKEAEPASVVEQVVAEDEQEIVRVEFEEEYIDVENDPYYIEQDPTGAVMNLWRKWEDQLPKPIISIACAGREDELFADKAELMRETSQMALNVERDARRSLMVIEELEKAKARRHRALEEAHKELIEKAVREAIERGEDPEAAAKAANVSADDEDDGPSLDACCHVYISRNTMVAWMLLLPPWGKDGSLRREMLDEALRENGIVHGIEQETVEELFEKKRYFRLTPVAFGTPPVEGENGKVIEHFLRELPREVKVDENGVADYRAERVVQIVDQGQAICDIIPPVEGSPGQGVTGQPVAPQKVLPAKAPSGANTRVTEDGTQVIAVLAGHVEFSSGVFIVKPVMEINGNVDYSTGNIEFRGDVHIRGDVRENFSVRATGAVTVDGLVEAATIEAGGNVMVALGVLGDNRALIKSGGRLQAKYLENCVAYASESIVADCIMACQTFCDGTIDVTSGRGTIIGGSLVAAQSIKARVIGCEAGRNTEITLGMLPYVQNEMIDIETDLAVVQAELKTLERDLNYLAGQDGMQGSSEKSGKARLRKSVLSMKEQNLLKQRERISALTPDLSKCRLEASTVYPATTVTVQGYIWRTSEVRNYCKLTYDTKIGEIRDA